MQKTNTQKPYLTKRHINSATRKGLGEASDLAMKTAGSVVAVEGNWVVRKHEDGTVEKIKGFDKAPKARIREKVSKLAFS